MNRTDRPARTDRHTTRDLGDELLLYDAAQDRMHVLNDTARDICLRCDGRHSVDDLVAAIVSAYEIDESTARRDVERALEQLLQLGVVTLNPAEPHPA